MTTVTIPDTLREKLASHDQLHVLEYWDSIDDESRSMFLQQLGEVDLDALDRWVAGKSESIDFAALAARAQGPPAVRSDGTGAAWSAAEAALRGEEVLRGGQLAILIVAGGQGTRLGFDAPKGLFPIGPVSQRTLFQTFADQIQGLQRRYGCKIPLLVMTSPATDAQTRIYFESNNYLGLDRDQVIVFQQGTLPAVDAQTGKLLLESKSSLALSPDGHGGTLAALDRSGALKQLRDSGVRYLFYAQVDNPLVPLGDPSLIGHHVMAGSEMTTQVVRKRFAEEKVGNVVHVDGRVQIIEYSDLPLEAAQRQDARGELALWAGNIAVHVFNLDFLDRMVRNADSLPIHRALKKVPFLDNEGVLVQPDEPNAIKFERFIFDLLPAAENAFVVEGKAAEVFAPVKNADGAPTDTPADARRQISALHAQWLCAAGVEVSPGVRVEIHPMLAMDASEVAEAVAQGRLPAAGTVVKEDAYFVPSQS